MASTWFLVAFFSWFLAIVITWFCCKAYMQTIVCADEFNAHWKLCNKWNLIFHNTHGSIRRRQPGTDRRYWCFKGIQQTARKYFNICIVLVKSTPAFCMYTIHLSMYQQWIMSRCGPQIVCVKLSKLIDFLLIIVKIQYTSLKIFSVANLHRFFYQTAITMAICIAK